MIDTIFLLMNITGLVAFAIAGSFKGIRQNLDLFGITVLGVITALGGGITRDLLVNEIPNALKSFTDFSFALAGSWIAVIIYYLLKKDIGNKHYILIPDAIGLSAFTTTGAIIGYQADVSFFGIVILATLTGIGGGMISDILLGKIPNVLKDDFYASCGIIGGILFYITIKFGWGLNKAAIICAFSVLIIRLLAIKFNWRLPKLS